MTREPLHVIMVCTGNICRSAMAEVVLTDRLLKAGIPVLTARPAQPRGEASAREEANGVVVSSAGVSDEERGNPIDPRAARVLAEHGYGQGEDAVSREVARRVRAHRARRITDGELAGADLILAMTSRHLRELERRAARLGVTDRARGAGAGSAGAGSAVAGGATEGVRISRSDAAAGTSGLPPALAGPRIRMYRAFDPAAPAGSPGSSGLLDVPDPWYGTMADFEDTLAVVERASDALAARLLTCPGIGRP